LRGLQKPWKSSYRIANLRVEIIAPGLPKYKAGVLTARPRISVVGNIENLLRKFSIA
jgi:hypothetical protein